MLNIKRTVLIVQLQIYMLRNNVIFLNFEFLSRVACILHLIQFKVFEILFCVLMPEIQSKMNIPINWFELL